MFYLFDNGKCETMSGNCDKLEELIINKNMKIVEDDNMYLSLSLLSLDGEEKIIETIAAIQPTLENKTDEIKIKYEKQIEELKDNLATATLANDIVLIEELKAEYAELIQQYKVELEDLNNEEKM